MIGSVKGYRPPSRSSGLCRRLLTFELSYRTEFLCGESRGGQESQTRSFR